MRLFATWFSPPKFYFWPKTEIIMLAVQTPNRTAVKKRDKKNELLNPYILEFFWTKRVFSTKVLCSSIVLAKVLCFIVQKTSISNYVWKKSEVVYFSENAGHLIAIILKLSFILFSHLVSKCFCSRKICFLLEQISVLIGKLFLEKLFWVNEKQ